MLSSQATRNSEFIVCLRDESMQWVTYVVGDTIPWLLFPEHVRSGSQGLAFRIPLSMPDSWHTGKEYWGFLRRPAIDYERKQGWPEGWAGREIGRVVIQQGCNSLTLCFSFLQLAFTERYCVYSRMWYKPQSTCFEHIVFSAKNKRKSSLLCSKDHWVKWTSVYVLLQTLSSQEWKA